MSRLFISIDPLWQRLAREQNCDAVRRIQWLKRHRNSNTTMSSYDIYSSTRGWALRPNIKDMNVWGSKILNANSKGIRGKIEYNYNKPSNKIRILILGNSFLAISYNNLSTLIT